jgi:GTP-binding protein
MSGKAGESVVLRVPPGTQIIDAGTGVLMADLTDGEFTAVRGGRGGRGNASFATPTRRAPRVSSPGQPGQAQELVLELKLIADVGIVGMPNAGKSTVISKVSAARPKVADYPFTTMTPSLGVVRVGDGESFVIADVPGLIEGAHQGAGLGHQFLRHVERTSVILHLVGLAPGDPEPVQAYHTVRNELTKYAEDLARRPSIVALNKIDLLGEEERTRVVSEFTAGTGVSPHLVSAATGEGIDGLVGTLAAALDELEKDKQ